MKMSRHNVNLVWHVAVFGIELLNTWCECSMNLSVIVVPCHTKLHTQQYHLISTCRWGSPAVTAHQIIDNFQLVEFLSKGGYYKQTLQTFLLVGEAMRISTVMSGCLMEWCLRNFQTKIIGFEVADPKEAPLPLLFTSVSCSSLHFLLRVCSNQQ